MKKAGLCVFDRSSRNICVLKRLRPYTKKCNPHRFVEEFSLPRGGQNHSKEDLKDCAIREYIEETGHYFKVIQFLPYKFDLKWTNPKSKVWVYTIFFAVASFDVSNIHFVRNKEKVNGIKIDFRKRCFEPLRPLIISIDHYKKLIMERLDLYDKNNYVDFFNFLEHIL